MGFQIFLSHGSLTDLQEIFDYIAADSPAAAERILRSLVDHTKILRAFPRMGTPVRRRPMVRKLFHSPYIIYYRVHADWRMG